MGGPQANPNTPPALEASGVVRRVRRQACSSCREPFHNCRTCHREDPPPPFADAPLSPNERADLQLARAA